MKKFSILIPAYNAEKFILDNLNSLKQQRYRDWEAIVVNDGSTDNTLDVVSSFVRKNPSLDIKIISIPNGGLANARNIALENCTGEYFCNLDADDFFEPEALAIVAEVNKAEHCDIYYYDIIDYDEITNKKEIFSDKFWKPTNTLSGIDAAIYKLQRRIWICQGVAFYRKKFIDDIGLLNIKGINQGEDMFFITASLSQAKSVKYIPYPGTSIRYRSDSMMHSIFNESHLQSVRAIDALQNYIDSKNIDISKKNKLSTLIQRERILQELRIDKSICDSCRSLADIKSTLGTLNKYSWKNSNPNRTIISLLSLSHRVQFYIRNNSPLAFIILTKLYRLIK